MRHAPTTPACRPDGERPASGRRRPVLPAALAAAVSLVLWAASAAPAAPPAGPFTGGAVERPLYVADDHTPFLIHFTATGLAPDTTYYVKMRMTVGPAPGSATNRGWTFNPATGRWAQERDYWSAFPEVTSDASGAIGGAAGYAWVKFGDESLCGTYYLLTSLSDAGADDTLNGTVTPTVTVLDMATSGRWGHNGAATSAAAAARAEAFDHATGSSLLALSLTGPNAVDDDGDGIVDNEDIGPSGATGDFRFALPLGQAADIRLGGVGWAPGQNVSSAIADADLALGAADAVAPGPIADLQAVPGDGRIDLSWSATTDNVDGPGTLHYIVYRWPDPEPIRGTFNYTPPRLAIAQTTATGYADLSVVDDIPYHYAVRACDTATNLGPRSPQADATADGTPPASVTGLVATAGDGIVTLAWTNPVDTDLTEIRVRRDTTGPPAGPDDGAAVYAGTGSGCDDIVANGATYHYAVFACDDAGNWSAGATTSAHPRAATALTLTASSSIVPFAGVAQLDGSLSAAGVPLTGRQVVLDTSADGVTWSAADVLDAATGNVSTVVTPVDKTFYRLRFAGDDLYAESLSTVVSVTPRVLLGKPSAPSPVKAGTRFRVRGSLQPRHPAGGHSVTIRCYKRVGGTWRLKKSVRAVNSDSVTATTYSVRLSLPSKGRWQLKAYTPPDAQHAATTSAGRLIRVR